MNEPKNRLLLAVAGGRKTQGLIDRCSVPDLDERTLILTYTVANQNVIRDRLRSSNVTNSFTEVKGWYSFLVNEIIRPFLPFVFAGKRIRGFDLYDTYQQGVGAEQWRRYANAYGDLRKVHAAHLAYLIIQGSNGAAISRLERVYDRIFIDEVQDLCGYDLDILRSILNSGVKTELVGDVRQAILSTNPQERRNKPFKFMKVYDWFKAVEKEGLVTITQQSKTWRCRPEISNFADTLFSEKWAFDPTQSMNSTTTDHDGMFLISPAHVESYIQEFDPLILRSGQSSGKEWSHFSPRNFGLSKGLEAERVLIIPTGAIEKHLRKGTALDDQQAAHLYVAVTRARQSVSFILENPSGCNLPYWVPPNEVSPIRQMSFI